VMFVPRVDVLVVDRLASLESETHIPVETPLGLALTGALTSTTTMAISSWYQTWFYSDGGTGAQFTTQQFAFPLRAMMHIRDVEACDLGVTFCRNLMTYTKMCYGPALRAEKIDENEIYK